HIPAQMEFPMNRPRLDHSIPSQMVWSRDRALAGVLAIAILTTNTTFSSANAQGAAQPAWASPPMAEAPVGHRQPNTQDVPPNVLRDEGAMTPGNTALDKKLNICRGC